MIRNSDQMLEEVNKLIFVKKYEEAESMIWDIVGNEQCSNKDLAHLRLIELSVKLGKISDLKRTYEERLRQDAQNPLLQTALVLAEQHAEMISPMEASAKFGDLLRSFGGSSAVYYGIGFCMEATSNFDRALYNYEQCINHDPSFYPGYFGMSQVYYQMDENNKGDYYFHIFEENAPYNVYGNFETHRRLSNEFLEDERYSDAELAIKALSEWWIDNKGICPPEIQIYELFCLARIAEYSGHMEHAAQKRGKAVSLVKQVLADGDIENGVLYFVAKTLEEFSEFELALNYYQNILTRENVTGDMVQKIGSQFLSLGEYDLSLQLFEQAYEHQPNNSEIRFCLLVSKLRLANVNVEDYLLQKERMKQLISNSSDRVELLSVLHNLVAKFDGDSEVHKNLGEIYLRLGNLDRSRKHYQKMFDLDPLSRSIALSYAGFEMQYGNPEEANRVLDKFDNEDELNVVDQNEINWLRASFNLREEKYNNCRKYLVVPLLSDPWNVSYLSYDAVCLTMTANVSDDIRQVDKTLQLLVSGEEEDLNWESFDALTEKWLSLHQYELAYTRSKLRLLYANKDDIVIHSLVKSAGFFDANRGIFDLSRLLNTNFDGPEIYWALGMLCKENWLLESACMWFEQLLMLPLKDKIYRAKAFLELADCFVWQDKKFEEAVEYTKIAMSMGERGDGRALTIIAHAFLRLGQVKQAELYLDDAEFNKDHEATYLKGLVHYRNGMQSEANSVWKPLLTVRSENLRFHNIKQEILKYYFDKAPYLRVN